MMKFIKFVLIGGVIIWTLLWIGEADADTETTEDVTEQSAGATHKCLRNNTECTSHLVLLSPISGMKWILFNFLITNQCIFQHLLGQLPLISSELVS